MSMTEHNGASVAKCDACDKRHDEVRKLIAFPHNIHICDECISICVEILHEDLADDGKITITLSELNRLRDAEKMLLLATIWGRSLKTTMNDLDATLNLSTWAQPMSEEGGTNKNERDATQTQSGS